MVQQPRAAPPAAAIAARNALGRPRAPAPLCNAPRRRFHALVHPHPAAACAPPLQDMLFEVVPRIDRQICMASHTAGPTAEGGLGKGLHLLSALPDVTGWDFAGVGALEGGRATHVWQYTARCVHLRGGGEPPAWAAVGVSSLLVCAACAAELCSPLWPRDPCTAFCLPSASQPPKAPPLPLPPPPPLSGTPPRPPSTGCMCPPTAATRRCGCTCRATTCSAAATLTSMWWTTGKPRCLLPGCRLRWA